MLGLGQAIVRQLELDRRGELPSRWMAHHLAELITAAQTAKGKAKQQAEDRAADLILKLWANRRSLPASADPLYGHLDAIKVLSAMLPSSNPWRRFQRGDSVESLLCDMFDALVQLVMSGLHLTRGRDIRKIEDAEWDALSEEERFLVENLDRWRNLFVAPAPEKISLEPIFVTSPEGDDEGVTNVGASDIEGSKEPKPGSEHEQRAAILAHVETFQAQLSDLIERWRAVGGLDGANDDLEEDE